MSDYPDWTDLVQIVGSDIMVPIDIQGSDIMLPVDIQAQFANLEIDIVAQTVGNIAIDIAAQAIGNIAINLAASEITLNVNIAASDITMNVAVTGTANIDITAQSVGISLRPVWAAEQDEDLNLTSRTDIAGNSGENVISYHVPTGKILYVGLLSCGGEMAHGWVELREGTTRRWGMNYWSAAFGMLVVMPFITPHKFVAGEYCNLYVYNDDPDAREMRGNLSCWLVPS